MRYIILIISITLCLPAFAWNQLETIDQANRRQQAERYQFDQQRRYRGNSLGNYPENLQGNIPNRYKPQVQPRRRDPLLSPTDQGFRY